MIGIGSDKKHCRHFHYHQLTCPPGQLYTSETISSASAPRSLQTLLHGRPNVSSPTGTSPAFRNVVACWNTGVCGRFGNISSGSCHGVQILDQRLQGMASSPPLALV